MPVDLEVQPRPGALAIGRPAGISWRVIPLVLVVLPLVLHERYQPTLTLHAASTSVDVRLSDAAVLAVAAAAAVAGVRRGFSPLRAGMPVWLASGAFLAWLFAATFYPLLSSRDYPWKVHLVTGLKFSEYALLALSLPLLIRSRRSLESLLVAVVAVGAAASTVGLLQFLGVDVFDAWRPAGSRQPSFVGVDDFSAVSAAVYCIALAAVAAGFESARERRLAIAAGIAGAVGLVASAALTGILGVVLAAGLGAVVVWRRRGLPLRRVLVLGAMVAVVVVGAVFMRSAAIGSFARFLGLGQHDRTAHVESYSHRWVLNYIGLRIFRDHPVVGTGWASAYDEDVYGPYLADAHARYPTQPALAFPSPDHPWGVQNAYIEVLAELGIVGFLLFGALIAAGLLLCVRALLRGPPRLHSPAFVGLLWLAAALGLWNGLWLIAGNPFDAMVWAAFGLAAAARNVLPADG